MKKQKHDPRETLATFAAALTGQAGPGTPFEDIAEGIQGFLSGRDWTKESAGELISGLIDELYVYQSRVISEHLGGKRPELQGNITGFERGLKRLIYDETEQRTAV